MPSSPSNLHMAKKTQQQQPVRSVLPVEYYKRLKIGAPEMGAKWLDEASIRVLVLTCPDGKNAQDVVALAKAMAAPYILCDSVNFKNFKNLGSKEVHQLTKEEMNDDNAIREKVASISDVIVDLQVLVMGRETKNFPSLGDCFLRDEKTKKKCPPKVYLTQSDAQGHTGGSHMLQNIRKPFEWLDVCG
eukprot:GHVO01027153.1.p1 GENE.GHVO01027153.1~~GHVO01027153.1.p1  ORF type:complete len:188 (+),score=25.55 GHVO01027153.1:89-652(+)